MTPPLRSIRTLPLPCAHRVRFRPSFRAAWLAGPAALALAAAAAPASAQIDAAGNPQIASQSGALDLQHAPPDVLGPPRLLPTYGAPPPEPRAAPSPPGADGLTPNEIFLEADVLVDDRGRKIVSGQGHVEARVNGRTLRADRIVYDTVSGLVRASGNVVIVNADATVEYSQDTELDDQLRAGVATGFAARLGGGTTKSPTTVVAAGTAIKRSDTVNEFKNAILTPCAICKADGVTPKTPTFSIQASTIVEDKVHSVVYYRHAVIRVLGLPVFYAPLFWTPDPTSDRRSGLLAPKITISKRRGFSYEQPYYFALTDYADLTVAPQINTSVNPLLNVQYRERFYSGQLDIRAGYTHEALFDSHGTYGDDTNRSYILANGRFDLSKAWDWGFGLERTTDPTFFRRYSIPQVFQDRGPFPADTDRLISQVFTQRIDLSSFLSISALSFQSLRAYGTDAQGHGLYESSKSFPVVGPLIDARWDPQTPIFGGRLRLHASGVVLSRTDTVQSVLDPDNALILRGPERAGTNPFLSTLTDRGSILSYTSSQRASGDVEWRRDFTLAGGLRMEPYVQARGDVYGIDGNPTITTAVNGVSTTRQADGVATRGDATVGVTASWPFYRPIGSTGSVILEPVVQLAYSPRLKLDPNIPDEDSVAFEFDETNLFSLNRLPGFDLEESGFRANIGGRADVLWGANHSASFTAGRVFRTQADNAFLPTTGVQGTASDWVYGATVSPLTGVSFFVRQRLDAETLAVHRNEAGLNVGFSRFNAGVRYSYNESGEVIDSTGQVAIGRVEDVQFSGGFAVTRNWTVSGAISRDMRQNVFPQSQLILTYHDDCVRVDTIYTHDETYSGVLGTSDSITFRLTLAILGDTTSGNRGRTR